MDRHQFIQTFSKSEVFCCCCCCWRSVFFCIGKEMFSVMLVCESSRYRKNHNKVKHVHNSMSKNFTQLFNLFVTLFSRSSEQPHSINSIIIVVVVVVSFFVNVENQFNCINFVFSISFILFDSCMKIVGLIWWRCQYLLL